MSTHQYNARTNQGHHHTMSSQHLPRFGLRKAVACAMAALQLLPIGLLASASSGAQAQQTAPTEFGYDPNGNLRYVIDPNNRTTDHTIDNLNRVKKQTLPPPSSGASRPEVSYIYDGQDRISSITDARGNTTTYTRSGLGDTVQSSPDTGTTSFLLDAAGQQSKVTNALGKGAGTNFDALGRIESIYDDSGYTSFIYDVYTTTPGSENYGRGRLGYIVEYALPDLGTPKSYVGFTYDLQGRVTKRCQILGSGACTSADTLTYRWGPATGTNAGRLLGLTYPSGRLVDYQYDALGRITGITTTNPGSSTAQTVLRDALYTPLAPEQGGHGLKSFTFGPTGASPTQDYQRAYDNSGRVSVFTLGKGAYTSDHPFAGLYTVGYDDASRILRINRFFASWSTANYAYDGLDRLTGMDIDGVGQFSYSYDANGNRTLKTAASTATNYVYPTTSNRLSSSQTAPGTSQAVTTDATGNITRDPATAVGVVNFIYNQRTNLPYGRLAKTQGPGGEYSYLYNYLGQRISKTGASYTPTGGSAIAPVAYIGSNNTLFHYDLDGKLIAELDPATKQVKREIIWLGEQPVAVIAGAAPTQMVSSSNAAAIYYVHTDHLNTPRMVTDTAGNRRWDWSPFTGEPFGATAPNEAPLSQTAPQQFAFNLRFPGQYLDKESGTSYNYYRNYNPATGRYLQSDPIGLQGGLNTYAYVEGNPLSYADPTGEMKLPDGPSGLPPDWQRDSSHRDPNGEKWVHPGGDTLDWHKGRPGMPGWRGKDHWHHNGGDDHLPPGTEVPDPVMPPAPREMCGDNCKRVLKSVRDAVTGAIIFTFVLVCSTS